MSPFSLLTKNLRARQDCLRTFRKLDFRSSKNNFRGHDISQPTPWPSLAVPSFSLDSTHDLPKSCNCRKPADCPMNGNCLKSSVIYQATVATNDNKPPQIYIGLTENSFKPRFTNHRNSFKDHMLIYFCATLLIQIERARVILPCLSVSFNGFFI